MPSQTQFIEAIKAVRDRTGWSQETLAQHLTALDVKVGQRSIANYEKGQHLPARVKQQAILDALATLESAATSNGDGAATGAPDVAAPSATHVDGDMVDVPVFGDMSAGPGRVPEVGVVATVPVPRSAYLASFRRPAADAEAHRVGYFVVRGDSAAPLYFDGEHVPCELLGNTNQTFEQDGLYVFRWQDMTMFKRLRRMPGGTIRARSLNPAVEPFTFEPEGDDFAVVARPIQSEKQQLYGSLVGRFLGYAEASNP